MAAANNEVNKITESYFLQIIEELERLLSRPDIPDVFVAVLEEWNQQLTALLQNIPDSSAAIMTR